MYDNFKTSPASSSSIEMLLSSSAYVALIASGSARKNSPFTRLFLTRFCSGRMGHSTYPYRMMVQMKAATSTATMGRLATFEQVAFNIDHSGLMENTKAASATCDLVSKARI